MTKPSQNPPPEPEVNQSRSAVATVLQWGKRPSTITFAMISLTIGLVGYFGVRMWLYQNLPGWIETELSKVIQRDVRVGQLKALYLTSLELGPSSIPATTTDPDHVAIKKIKVGFNPLPLLLKRPLPVTINLVHVDVYAQQEANGEWINLKDLNFDNSFSPPIDFDAKVRVWNGKIALLPYGQTNPFKVRLDATAGLSNNNQRLRYNITTTIAEGKTKLEGKTWLTTGQTKAWVNVQNLALAELMPLIKAVIPNIPANLQSGELDAKLNISLPSIKDIPDVKGKAVFKGIQVQVNPLKEPVKASARLRFQGDRVRLEKTQGSYGAIEALVSGQVGWTKGFDLNVDVTPFSLAKLLKTVPVKSPVPVNGEMAAELSITGPIDQPEVTGKLRNTKVTTIDKVKLAQIQADLAGNFSQVVLTDFLVKPEAGGKITGRGQVKLASDQQGGTKGQAMPLAFDFIAALPVDAMLRRSGYANASPNNLLSQITLGNLDAQATIRGNTQNPQGSLIWQAPALSTSSSKDIGVSGAGELLLLNQNILLRNTQVKVGKGTITATGTGNLKTSKWEAAVVANAVPLDPFLPLSGQLTTGKINLSGSLKSFSPKSIEATGDMQLGVEGGKVKATGQVNRGMVELEARASKIQLNKLVPKLGLPIGLDSGKINLSGSLESLLSSSSTPNLNRLINTIDGNFNGLLGVGGGRVNATGQLNSGNLDVNALAGQIQLNPLVSKLAIPLALRSGQLNLSGSLGSLLASALNQDFNSFNTINANFQGNLGVADGEVNARGQLNSGNLDVNALAGQIQLNPLVANLPIPVALRSGQLNLSGTLASLLTSALNQDLKSLNTINANFQGNLGVADGEVNAKGQLNSGNLDVNALAGQIQLNPLVPDLTIPVALRSGQLNLSGSLGSLLASALNQDLKSLNTIDANFEGNLGVADGQVNAKGQLKSGNLDVNARATEINLSNSLSNSFPNLALPIALKSGNAKLSSSLESLLAFGSSFNLDLLKAIQASFDGNLGVGGGNVNAIGQFTSGVLTADAIANSLDVGEIASQIALANFPNSIDTQIGGKVKLKSRLNTLDPPTLLNQTDLQADLDGVLAQGKLNLNSTLSNGLWQAAINTTNLDSSLLVSQLLPQLGNQKLELGPVNSKLNLSGNLNPLLNPGAIATIKANTISLELPKHSFNANGVILLSHLTKTNPSQMPWEIGTDLNLEVGSDLSKLPYNLLLSRLPLEQISPGYQIQVKGQADLNGRIQGKNLLSAPFLPGNVNLTGNLQLSNLKVNDLTFEPVLAGPVTVAPGQELAIDLRGKKDAIASRLQPCTRGEQCLAPYLPASFTLKQGQGSQFPMMITGVRRGDNLTAQIKNFSLAILNLRPGLTYGIPGKLQGEVTGQANLNLFTLETSGRNTIDIKQLALGEINAKQVSANFSYQDHIAQIASAALILGNSRYLFKNGRFNLKSQEINGKLTIPEAYIEDLLTIVKRVDIIDIVQGFQTTNSSTNKFSNNKSGNADQLRPLRTIPAGSLAAILQRFAKINAQEDAVANPFDPTTLLSNLDIRGKYTGEIAVAGILNNPKVNFNVEGNNWQWYANSPNQVIVVNQLVAKGSYDQGVITVQPARMKLGETVLAFQGQLAQESNSGDFLLQNLSLETVSNLASNFVTIPFDIAGNLNAKGELGGSLTNPQVTNGQVAFVDGSVNDTSLDDVEVTFDYVDSRLDFDTNKPDYLQASGKVPFPPKPNSDRIDINLKLATPAMALLSVVTQEQVAWVNGEDRTADIELDVSGRLELADGIKIKDLSGTSEVNIQNGTIKTKLLEDDFTLNVVGKVKLDQQRLEVVNYPDKEGQKTLEGNLAGIGFSLSGELPIASNKINSSNPLTLKIPKDNLKLAGLYEGGVASNIVITGSALRPVIGGNINLENGQAFIPKIQETKTEASDEKSVKNTSNQTPSLAPSRQNNLFVPRLKNFQVNLVNELRVQQFPIYDIRLAGDLTLNGPINGNLQNLQGLGTITLRRWEVDVLETEFV
ncbi:translocation/assembly module TamB domain-containing protein, partial [Moorena sp. SIO4G3]|uniref:translocation/assembly module TamB domain-containing protein n=1 Tax=Moorena sp. SIO4G3 TaxID=2607821 RepID=UPI00142AFE58